MHTIKTELENVLILEPRVFGDERGYFCETFKQSVLDDALGFRVSFVQDNESKSSANVFRGLHYQLAPYAQSKLVRVVQGTAIDIILDIRKGSPTFGKYITVELSGANRRQLFIPRGFAHGFLATEDETIFAYKVDNYYSPECERGVHFSCIDYPLPSSVVVSSKDYSQPNLESADLFDYGIDYYA